MHKHLTRGFTVVELATIIFIVGILVSVTVAGYNGWQHRTAQNTVKSDLMAVASAMKTAGSFKNTYPSTIDALAKSFTASPEIALSLTLSGGGQPVYNNLSDVQNGVLFHSICGELIAEGSGRGVNEGGQTEQYITACNVYNKPQIQVNSAWTSQSFNTPVNDTVLPDLVSTINYNDAWRPARDVAEKEFYQTWHQRFTASGGTYPVTSFWDPWANGMNGGVQKQSLPTPSTTNTVTAQQAYCVQALSAKYPDEPMHVDATSMRPVEGPC